MNKIKTIKSFYFVCMTVLALSLTVSAADIWVATDGNDLTGDGSENAPYASLTNAYEKASDGDVILVKRGEYIHNLVNHVTLEKEITIKSAENDPGSVHFICDAQKGDGTQEYAFMLNHAKAVIDGVTIRNFRKANYNGYNKRFTVGIIIEKGTVKNCVISGTGNQNIGCGVWINGTDAVLTNCVVSGVTAANMTGGTDQKYGGVYLVKGLVADCDIYGNKATMAAGIYVVGSGAKLINSRIYNNEAGHRGGGGVRIGNGGIVENCIITNNVAACCGAGILMEGSASILRNCLVAFNREKTASSGTSYVGGGGLYLQNGTVQYCTIAQNSASDAPAGLYQANGTVVNSIIFGNGVGETDNYTSAGGSISYSLLDREQDGDGNVAGNPKFADSENGDFSLLAGSPALDAAQEIVDSEGQVIRTSLNGIKRYEGEGYDIGAYEMPEIKELICYFELDKKNGYDETITVTLTAKVENADGNCQYYWTIGDTELKGSASPTLVYPFSIGSYDITLRVVDEGKNEATSSEVGAVVVYSTKAYVSENGKNIYPYHTPETAATNIQDAVNAVYASDERRGIVFVAGGVYGPKSADDEVTVKIDKNISLVGDANNRAVINARPGISGNGVYGSNNRRVISVNHENAFVANLVFSNGFYYAYTAGDAGGVWLTKGTISNSVITKCNGYASGGMRIAGGLFTDGAIINCDSANYGMSAIDKMGGGVYMKGGVIRNTVISGNKHGIAGAVSMEKGSLIGCTITNNWSNGYGVIWMGSKDSNNEMLIDRCYIADNKVSSGATATTASAVYMTSAKAKISNSIIVNNYPDNTKVSSSAIYATKGTNVNITVFNNQRADLEGKMDSSGNPICNYDITLNGANTLFVNSIAGLANFVSGSERNNFVGSDPKFKKTKETAYYLSGSSPCIDVGDSAFWNEDSVDFLGNTRIARNVVDLGACEYQKAPGSILIFK